MDATEPQSSAVVCGSGPVLYLSHAEHHNNKQEYADYWPDGSPRAGRKIRVVQTASSGYLEWDADDCRILRTQCYVAVSPVGLCTQKLATRGKAAAVPVMLSDEEVWLLVDYNLVEIVHATTGATIPGLEALALREADAVARACLSHFSPSAAVPPHMPASCWERTNVLLHRAVFSDLWKQGYRCTNGIKFGVDYLAYTRDPSEVHAAFMVVVVPEGHRIAPLDLTGRSRVATTALKVCVLAYVDLHLRQPSNDHMLDAAEPSTSAAGETKPRAATIAPVVRYEAFKRIGPGSVVFTCASATLEALKGLGNT